MDNKDKESELCKIFPPCVLYINDVENIIELFKGITDKIALSTHDRELKNIDELSEINKSYITNLRIKSEDPYISLNLTRNRIKYCASKDNKENRYFLKQIKDTLLPLRRKFSFLFGLPSLIFLLVALIVGIIWLSQISPDSASESLITLVNSLVK